jgi:hypothetical protein
MKQKLLYLLSIATLWSAGIAAADAGPAPRHAIERGRYMVRMSGCNDCHTPGYQQQDGQVPEAQWLTGSDLGWRGPWGTTYASNLRLLLSQKSEADWLKLARGLHSRPPMPSYVLWQMRQDDLVSIYRFIRSLGPAGSPAPAYLPPDQAPAGPFVQFPAPPPEPSRKP